VPVDSIETWMKSTGIYHMDGNQFLHPSASSVTATVEGQDFKFRDVELAPPCAVAAINYSR
jgi:hypothetical protein